MIKIRIGKSRLSLAITLTSLLFVQNLLADTLPVVRVAVLVFGTVNWELDVMKHHEFDHENGFTLEVLPLSSKNAVNVALQGGAADVVVNDWIWVSRQRDENRLYTFVPYSIAVGELLAHPDAGIDNIASLVNKKVGIAGGPVDKNWLLLRAYALKTLDLDLGKQVNTHFAAPPLLNELITRGDLDAVLNFWHYAARLRAAEMHSVIEVKTMLSEFDIAETMPLLGWVFSESWASENKMAIIGFLRASYRAKKILLQSDDEWLRLRPLLKVDDDGIADSLRDAYRKGIPRQFGAAEQADAAKVFSILAEQGGDELTGASTTLNPGTFWDKFDVKLPQ